MTFRRSIFLTAAVLFFASSVQGAPVKNAKPRVDLVFVLDTTGSMGGLIQGAKEKIWSIVNEIAKAKPQPEIRLGLIGYRDKGDAYVTTRTDLTTDLDAVYEKLMSFRAEGGGDTPEHVNQALWEAVHKMTWSPERKALKIIFLVGDAPPHMDYSDDVKYAKTCKDAMQKDLIINAIQCGQDASTMRTWKDIAIKAEGRYVALAQSGGTLTIATPYDGDLSRLSGELDHTYVTYGKAAARKKSKAKMARSKSVMAEAAPEAAASRASYRASTGLVGSRDLLKDEADGTVKLDKLSDDELPDELKGKTPAQRKAFLEKKKKERVRIQKEIAQLSKKRAKYIRKQMSKSKKGGDSFDEKVIESIREKASKKGLSF